MAQIFWFQPRNKRTGILLDEYVECDERIASEYFKEPLKMVYVGQSDVASFIGLLKKLIKDANGIAADFDEEHKEKLRMARFQEIDKAKQNKTPPRDFSRMNLEGGPMDEKLKRFTQGMIN